MIPFKKLQFKSRLKPGIHIRLVHLDDETNVVALVSDVSIRGNFLLTYYVQNIVGNEIKDKIYASVDANNLGEFNCVESAKMACQKHFEGWILENFFDLKL